jgi:photosystem II protein PsbQ
MDNWSVDKQRLGNDMKRFGRLLISALLVCLIAVGVWTDSALAAKSKKTPTTYSAGQIEAIGKFQDQAFALRERMTEIEDLIDTATWRSYVPTQIRGPLGDLRRVSSNINRLLLPKDKEQALDLTKSLFQHIEALDSATQDGDALRASREYSKALGDLDAYLELVPDAA